jgi:23S rRNA U2552 (ribose-2'-O)-methylase RlmE/FtsJ
LVPAREVDVVLSIRVPNLSGMDAIDAPRCPYLTELAPDITGRVLNRGHGALIKVFKRPDFKPDSRKGSPRRDARSPR